MKLDLPTPGRLRDKKRRREICDLLDAQIYVPPLVARLSAGFITVDEATASRWAGWIAALRDDPGWELIEPVLHTPQAWPDVWTAARDAGFSQATEHHNALFFTRQFERACQIPRFELARKSWNEALISWAALGDEDYLRHTVLGAVVDELAEEQLRQVLTSLLDGPLSILEEMAVEALSLNTWEAPPARRPLLFVTECLEQAKEIFSGAHETFPDSSLISGVLDGIAETNQAFRRALINEFDRLLGDLDPAKAERDEFLELFDCALLRCERLGFPPQLDRAVLRRGLNLIWDLRETDRDEELAIVPPMLDRLEPCTERLREAGGDDFFGLEGAVADLYVFKGEEGMRLDTRQAAFEEALQICPGHRNASRLLSYLLLERANRELLKTSALPDATSVLGPARRRLQPIFERAAQAIDRAEELYPDNDLVHRYRADLDAELDRFKLAVQESHDD